MERRKPHKRGNRRTLVYFIKGETQTIGRRNNRYGRREQPLYAEEKLQQLQQ